MEKQINNEVSGSSYEDMLLLYIKDAINNQSKEIIVLIDLARKKKLFNEDYYELWLSCILSKMNNELLNLVCKNISIFISDFSKANEIVNNVLIIHYQNFIDPYKNISTLLGAGFVLNEKIFLNFSDNTNEYFKKINKENKEKLNKKKFIFVENLT